MKIYRWDVNGDILMSAYQDDRKPERFTLIGIQHTFAQALHDCISQSNSNGQRMTWSPSPIAYSVPVHAPTTRENQRVSVCDVQANRMND